MAKTQAVCPLCGQVAAEPTAPPPGAPSGAPPTYAPPPPPPRNNLYPVLGVVGLVVAIVVVLAIAGVFSHDKKQSSLDDLGRSTGASQGGGENLLRQDLLATSLAENKFRSDYGRYTNSMSELQTELLQFHPGTDIAIGIGGLNGYCAVASYNGTGSWYLLDSATGQSANVYGDVGQAERACSIAAPAFSAPTIPTPIDTSATNTAPQPLTDDDAQVRSDLRAAATAEESFLTDNDEYTNRLSDLVPEGYQASDTQIAIAVRSPDAYCLAGARNGSGNWWLYSSVAFGMSTNSFPSASEAEAACTIPGAQFSSPSSS